MPDDSLFTPNAEPSDPPTPPVTDPPAGDPPANGTPPLTAEAAQALIQEAVGPLNQQVSTLQAENQTLRSQMQTPPPAPPEPVNVDEFLTDFTTDPEASIRKLTEKITNEQFQQLAPLFQQQNQNSHDTLVTTHQIAIDSEYGAGTWEAEFAPVFGARVTQIKDTAPLSVTSSDWIRQEVNAIKGLKMNELFSRKTEANKATQDRQESHMAELAQRVGATGMTGGLRMTSADPNRKELTDAEKAYVASKKQDGQETDIATLRRSATSGNTLTEYLAAQAAAEGAK